MTHTPSRAPGDAIDLSTRILRGELTASQALDDALARVHALNPTIGAVASVAEEAGRADAQAHDRTLSGLDAQARAALATTQPFFGVPSLLKDLGTAARGVSSSMGSQLFGRIDWDHDCELVARYKRAGLVFFGRSTSSELGLSPTTESPSYGEPTRNPWNTAHSAGGSSGGAGAAVASGMVPLAHGGDGGGSIRIPASCCGVLGLKPSRGMMPLGPYRGEGWGGMTVDHVLTTSVRDSAAALDATAGADPGAPYAAPARPASYLALVQAASRSPDGGPRLRIALLPHGSVSAVRDADVAAALARIASALQSLGHRVDEGEPAVTARETLENMLPVIACNAALSIARFVARRGTGLKEGELQPTVQSMVAYARSIDGVAYAGHVDTMHTITRRVARFFDGTQDGGAPFDLILSPVLSEAPARIGRFAMHWEDYLDYRLGDTGLIGYSPYAPLANLTGCPAISIPFGLSTDGLPIGMQLMAPQGGEAVLLQVAAQLEAVHPWPRYAPVTAGVAAAP